MLIIGIDPGINGAICLFKDGKIVDVFEMPKMDERKKNKSQVNASQIFNEIQKLLKDEFPKPGSARGRKNNSPEKGKTTLLEVKNA